MKHCFLSFLLLALSTLGMAQINLREGIVITLAGDTLHGDIDYRTDAINSEQCLFRQDGGGEFITYKPGAIQGYRFLENGRFYVSKTIVTSSSNSKTVFLEHVVRGQLNLYYFESQYVREYYLEDENGKMARFEVIEKDAPVQQRRQNLAAAYNMTDQSARAQEILWKDELSRKNVTKAIVNYNHDVCPDGECEVLEYPAKKTPQSDRGLHFFFKIGGSLYQETESELYMTADNRLIDKKHDVTKKEMSFAFGYLYDLKRLSRGLYAESFFETNFKKEGDSDENAYSGWTSLFRSLRLGLGYQWRNLPVQPRLHGGIGVLGGGPYCGTGLMVPVRHIGGITLDMDIYLHDNKYYCLSLGYQF